MGILFRVWAWTGRITTTTGVRTLSTALRMNIPLYRNEGGDFAEATSKSRLGVLTRQMAGWGVVFADLDNDGWKDIAAARSVRCRRQAERRGGEGGAFVVP
jgi:hypothetical protein